MRTGRPPKPYTERFWNFVNPIPDKCWEWKGKRDKQGYGVISVPPTIRPCRELRAHRVSFEIKYGVIAPGILVLHKCDNPPCVNWDHLFDGTYKDNILDAIAKNRFANDSHEWRIKDAVIHKIISLKGLMKQQDVANKFGISRSYVSMIWSGKKRIVQGTMVPKPLP